MTKIKTRNNKKKKKRKVERVRIVLPGLLGSAK